MAEGGIYLCRWKKSKRLFALELHANPEIKAQATELEDAMEQVCLQVMDWNGDGEAVLELYPPRKGKICKGGVTVLKTPAYNDSVRVENYATLFEHGACPTCKHGIGARTDAPFAVTERPKGIACGIDGCYPCMTIYRKPFVDALTATERAAIVTRPVVFAGDETEYLQLLPLRSTRTVGYRGARYPEMFHQSWQCGACNRQKFSVEVDGIRNSPGFISADDIDGLDSRMLFVDDGWHNLPAFLVSRWQELLGLSQLRGLLSSDVIVIEPDFVEAPGLKKVNEFDWVM